MRSAPISSAIPLSALERTESVIGSRSRSLMSLPVRMDPNRARATLDQTAKTLEANRTLLRARLLGLPEWSSGRFLYGKERDPRRKRGGDQVESWREGVSGDRDKVRC